MPDEKNMKSIALSKSSTLPASSATFDLSNKGSMTEKIKQTYHGQRIGQSKWAFRLSLWGSIIGFAVIVWGIWRSVAIDSTEWLGLISGTILEAVSILFYSLSNKANEKISEFFTELTKDANVKNAMSLSNEIQDSKVKDELKVKLALYLVGINEERICRNTKEICEIQNISGNEK